uniref:Uncharacterized protein n=1 Tax=Triticum urartu TaxID=4572 RepID=A0A8R7V1Y4_TRIUA
RPPFSRTQRPPPPFSLPLLADLSPSLRSRAGHHGHGRKLRRTFHHDCQPSSRPDHRRGCCDPGWPPSYFAGSWPRFPARPRPPLPARLADREKKEEVAVIISVVNQAGDTG